jgi:hypothetical protein
MLGCTMQQIKGKELWQQRQREIFDFDVVLKRMRMIEKA